MYAPVHQHFFVARMDFCVDGVKNSIVEYNAEAETEGPHNPTLNGFFFKETPLVSELVAVRDLSPETARYRYILLVAFIHSCNLRFEQLFVQYMFSHTHTHMCSLSLTHTHTHMSTHTHTHTHLCFHTHTHTHMLSHTHTYAEIQNFYTIICLS